MTTYHMRLDIKGFLLNNHDDCDFEGIFQNENGVEMSAESARRLMLDKLSQGVKFLPCTGCDNFDQEKGCQGHPDSPEEMPEGHRSPLAVAPESGSPSPVARGTNPEGDASGGVFDVHGAHRENYANGQMQMLDKAMCDAGQLPEMVCHKHGPMPSKDGLCPACEQRDKYPL